MRAEPGGVPTGCGSVFGMGSSRDRNAGAEVGAASDFTFVIGASAVVKIGAVVEVEEGLSAAARAASASRFRGIGEERRGGSGADRGGKANGAENAGIVGGRGAAESREETADGGGGDRVEGLRVGGGVDNGEEGADEVEEVDGSGEAGEKPKPFSVRRMPIGLIGGVLPLE